MPGILGRQVEEKPATGHDESSDSHRKALRVKQPLSPPGRQHSVYFIHVQDVLDFSATEARGGDSRFEAAPLSGLCFLAYPKRR